MNPDFAIANPIVMGAFEPPEDVDDVPAAAGVDDVAAGVDDDELDEDEPHAVMPAAVTPTTSAAAIDFHFPPMVILPLVSSARRGE
jgi:hypothetical protein